MTFRCLTRSSVFKRAAGNILSRGMFRADLSTEGSTPSATRIALGPASIAFKIPAISAVFDVSRLRESRTTSWPSLILSDRADTRDSRLILLGVLCRKLRGRGPNTTPPPFQWGARIDPWRACPVPFCARGFLPPPETSPRVLVLAVPTRVLESCPTTTWCISAWFGGVPKTSSRTWTVPTTFPCVFQSGSSTRAIPLASPSCG